MKSRRHHNNKGRKQVKEGRTHEQVKRIAKKTLGKGACAGSLGWIVFNTAVQIRLWIQEGI